MDHRDGLSGIEGLGDMSWGTHFCLFYETEQDLLETLALYFKPGLANNEYCLWITPDSSNGKARNALRQVIPSADQHLEKGDIEILSCQQWYCENDEFDGARVIQAADTKLSQALEKGYTRMRALADEAWLDQELWGAFSDYESKLDERFAGKPISILCAYPTATHSAADILDVARTHRFIAAKRNGNWEILEAPELKHALRKARDELEAEIQERTANLKQVNQALQAEIIEHKRSEEALRTNEYRLQAAINAADIVLWERDLSSGHITWLGHYEKLLGFAPGELGDNTLADFEKRVHPEDIENLRTVRRRALEERSEYSHEYRVVWRDGNIHWIRAQGRFLYNEADQPVRLYGAVLDITERKRAEAELQKQREILQTIFDNVPAMITMVDKDGRFILINRDFENRLGWRLDEISERNPDMLAELYPDAQARQAVLDFAERADGRWEDLRTRAKDGRVIDTSWALVRLSDGSIIGVGKDITERKQAEEALRKSERVLREAEELGHTGSWEQDLVTGEIFNTEENLRLFFGDDRSKGANLEDYAQVVHPDDREYVLRRRAELLEEEGPGDIEYRVVWPDGNVHVIFGRATVVRDELNRPIRVYGTNVDITKRKRAEEAIRKSERVLREAEELGHTGSWEQDLVTGETFNSDANFRLFFGDDRSKGASFEDFVQAMHPDDREYVLQRRAQLIAEGRPGDTEFRVVWPDGGIHVIHRRATVVHDESGKVIRLYGTNVDITERKRAEEEIKRQAVRSETLARIAARLNKQLDLDAVIHAVCEETINTFQVSQATMSLYDKKRDLLAYAGGINIPPEYAAKMEPISRAQFDEFDRTMGPILVVPDIQALPNVPNAEFTTQFDVRTVVTADMQRDQQLIGVLVLGVNGHVREFDKDELTLLKAISDQAAQAIANARLFQTVSEHAARMEALVEISRTFAKAGLDYQSILNTVARRTAEIIGDACVITLFSDDAQRSFPVAFHHPDPKALSMMHNALMHTWQGGTDTQRYQTLLAGDSIYIPFVNPEEFQASLEPEFWTFFEAIGISSVLIVPLKTDGHVIGTLGITRDRQGNPYTHDDQVLLQNIADRAALSIQNAQLFRQVQTAREQLEALSRRLLEVQEAERRALTSELHDRVGQNLTGLSINLQNMKALLSDEMAKILATKFDDAQAIVQDTTRQIRDIMAELHLPELEDYGLAAALETYAERAASRGNLELIADLPDLDPPRLPSDIRATLFRAAQEAISNVLKHANATTLEVSLEGRNGRVRLKIEDNGQGFEPDLVSQKKGQTWGLQIMRERVESIGGNVQIESQPGQGTRVTFDLERPS